MFNLASGFYHVFCLESYACVAPTETFAVGRLGFYKTVNAHGGFRVVAAIPSKVNYGKLVAPRISPINAARAVQIVFGSPLVCYFICMEF